MILTNTLSLRELVDYFTFWPINLPLRSFDSSGEGRDSMAFRHDMMTQIRIGLFVTVLELCDNVFMVYVWLDGNLLYVLGE